MGVFLQGCAVGGKVQEFTSIEQEVGSSFSVEIGEEIYTSKREKSLPNAFGKADIFGRRTPSGMTYVVYAGIENDQVVLFRRSVDIYTGATTMNSTPIVLPNTYTSSHSGNIGGTYYSGTTTTQGSPTVILPNSTAAQYFDKGAIPVLIPVKELPASITIESNEIKILDATPYRVTVLIKK